MEEEDEGSLILEVKIANLAEGVSWVLGFGSNAIVKEPAWFARAVRKELRLAARNYHKPRSESGKGSEDMAEEENGAGEGQ